MNCQCYERIGIFSPEDVLPHITFNSNGQINNNPRTKIYNNQEVNMFSLRYRTFLVSGLSCKKCGVTGMFFALEKSKFQTEKANPNNRYHFNLYGLDSNGLEVLITKDHIIPKSKTGTNDIENLQTMCTICNGVKKDDI